MKILKLRGELTVWMVAGGILKAFRAVIQSCSPLFRGESQRRLGAFGLALARGGMPRRTGEIQPPSCSAGLRRTACLRSPFDLRLSTLDSLQIVLYARRPMDKLTEIVEWKRREIAARVRDVPRRELEAFAASSAKRPSFAGALKRNGRLAVIAEMKRRSPSAGTIAADASAVEQAEAYARAGADAVSVLTDQRYFGGSLGDLNDVTARFAGANLRVPCLRKDFMVHPVQVIEAAAAGASAILIIVRALNDEEIAVLFEASSLAGLDALFEVHEEAEIERAVWAGAKIIGVNNRDLAAFETDLTISERLLPLLPDGVVRISESGIQTKEDAARMRAARADAVLVGEALMRAAGGPGSLIASFHKS